MNFNQPINQTTMITEEQKLEIIHMGINFSKGIKSNSEPYKLGVAFGYSCGYETAETSKQEERVSNPDGRNKPASGGVAGNYYYL